MSTLAPSARALVALVPGPVSAEIDRWRSRYDPNFQIVPPHITVAYPPFVPPREWEEMRSVVGWFLKRFAPFCVQLEHLGVFWGSPSYLWLALEDGGSFSRIRQALVQLLPKHMPTLPFVYVPHVTIGAFSSDYDLLVAKEAVRSAWKPFLFELTELVYMAPNQRGVWCVCSDLPLGSADRQ
jgi:2'-5' RNA ligase